MKKNKNNMGLEDLKPLSFVTTIQENKALIGGHNPWGDLATCF